jgi:hypothetical protein
MLLILCSFENVFVVFEIAAICLNISTLALFCVFIDLMAKEQKGRQKRNDDVKYRYE